MGQQQIILIILCVIVVGTAIGIGLTLFEANAIAANRDALIEDLNNLATNAQSYYLKPKSAGGGGSSFVGYKIPRKLRSNENGRYECYDILSTTIRFRAYAAEDENNRITALLDCKRTSLSTWSFGGDFDDSE